MLLGELRLGVTHTISVPEITWTILCALGFLFTAKCFYRSYGDLKFLRTRHINSIREHSAITTVFVFGLMTFIQVVYVIIGVIAMMLPSPTGKVQPLTFVLTGVFVTVSAITVIMTFIVNARKEQLIQMLEELEKRGDKM